MHGIGGNTVQEAKERLTVTEVRRWAAYIAKYGTLNVSRRVAEGSGTVAFVTSKAFGGKGKLSDFIPHYESGTIASVADVAAIKNKVKHGA